MLIEPPKRLPVTSVGLGPILFSQALHDFAAQERLIGVVFQQAADREDDLLGGRNGQPEGDRFGCGGIGHLSAHFGNNWLVAEARDWRLSHADSDVGIPSFQDGVGLLGRHTGPDADEVG